MIARLARKRDADAIHRLLSTDAPISFDRDMFVVIGDPPHGALVWRPCAFVHQLAVGDGARRLDVARSLVNFAVGNAIAHPWLIRDTIFGVKPENAAMLRFVQRIHAVPEYGSLFSLEL